MLTNVLQYLEETLPRVPDKIAFANEEMALTFRQVSEHSRAIASHLHREGFYSKPIIVFMKRQPKTIAAFFGTIYSGNYYVPLDEEMPRHRVELIFKTLDPGAIICDETTRALVEEFDYNGKRYLYDEICTAPVDDEALAVIRDKQLDTDPIYIVFTSGSTGTPKGVIACHRSVIDYIEHLSEVLKFNEDTAFGNQTPLYFDACLKEIYPTLKYGATTYLVPKQLFMFPIKLVEFLNEYKINTVCWVVSALTMISSMRTFDKVKPEYLHTIAFASEVFPIKQFNLWRAALPSARFINLYGPTEVTGICCYYEVDREFSLEESLPVGRPFRNTGIILLDENDKEPAPGEQGEICVRGTCLTLGYYRNPEKTNETFVQNPLNDLYPELIYRTGDIGMYNERGELVFLSRKDYQIKHMGHRVELGEIEANVNMVEGVRQAACIYNAQRGRITLCYTGALTEKELMTALKESLPRYMLPNRTIRLEEMPYTANGKLDRTALKNTHENG